MTVTGDMIVFAIATWLIGSMVAVLAFLAIVAVKCWLTTR